MHPKVGICWRQGSGLARFGGRSVRFGKVGQSDLMAVLKGGRFLAVETKAPGEEATEEQYAFLQSVISAGGLACCVDSVDKLALFLKGA